MSTLKLTKPIEAHGEKIDTLNFRDAEGADLRVAGSPVYVVDNRDNTSSTKFDHGALAIYISRLAQIPPTAVDKLPPADWNAAKNEVLRLLGFFTEQTSEQS